METINSYEGWVGTDAYDVNGDKIGAIDAIYYDDQTGRPGVDGHSHRVLRVEHQLRPDRRCNGS